MALALILLFNLWWRGHTFGPDVRDRFGVTLWPVVEGQSEPLDCDEAAYAYMGRRMVEHGDRLYEDLSENKPPGSYWLYALAVAVGGANEWTIRLLPIPLVFLTTAMVWWIGLKLGGPGSATLAALIHVFASTDPYIYANAAQIEHAINFGAVGSLALLVSALPKQNRSRFWLLAVSGVLLGYAALVRQVAVLHLPVYAFGLWWIRARGEGEPERSRGSRLADFACLAFGFAGVWVVSIAVLIAQGSGPAAYEDIVLAGSALVTDRAPDPTTPPPWMRWLTGNADPSGKLPWPFGKTDYLEWWGSGTWPLWLASIPALSWLWFGQVPNKGPRRLIVAWTLSAWVQVTLPGQYWPHYYLLPVPGAVLAVAITCTNLLSRFALVSAELFSRFNWRSFGRATLCLLSGLFLLAALGWMMTIQVRDYLHLRPEQITIQHKGGQQWVDLRTFGRELKQRSTVWEDPHLFVWGWQSPLHIYSELDGVSRHFFVNDLLRDHAGTEHPLIGPRVEEIQGDLRAQRPELILVGYPPYPALLAFLREDYLPSTLSRSAPDGRGLWVRKDRYGAFETFQTQKAEAPAIKPSGPPVFDSAR